MKVHFRYYAVRRERERERALVRRLFITGITARFLEIYNKAAILDTVGYLYARWRSATCATRAGISAKMKTDSGESYFRVRTKPLRKLRL